MPGTAVRGADELAALGRRLREAGETRLRRELYAAITDAARPLARKISTVTHLRSYVPARYARALAADLQVRTLRTARRDPSVSIRCRGRSHDRQVRRLERGVLNHPVFAEGPRAQWKWSSQPVRPGFFYDPCTAAAPQIRDDILAAMHHIGQYITRG